MWKQLFIMIKAFHVQVHNVTIWNACTITVSNKSTGSGLEFVEAVGLVIIGHFSLDGQLKKEHYTEKHHNMFVVENRCELLRKLMKLFSYTGQTVVEIVTETSYSGKNVIHTVESQLSEPLGTSVSLKSPYL